MYRLPHTNQNIAEGKRTGQNAKSVHSSQYIVNIYTDTFVESNTDVDRKTNKSKAPQKTITNANMKSDIDEEQRLLMSQLSEKHLMVEKRLYKSDYRCMY